MKIDNQRGAIAIIAFLTLSIMLLLGAYFLSFSVVELRISKSEQIGKSAYYLAEAGINQAIWKLRNDIEWLSCFSSSSIVYNCDCENWSSSFNQDTSNLAENSSVAVSIQNSECGRGQITATSTQAFGPLVSQRVVKTQVFKAAGIFSPEALLGDGNVDTYQSILSVFDGNLSADGNIEFRKQSSVSVYDDSAPEEQKGQVLAGGNITISQSTLTASSTCSANMCTELCEGYAPGLTSCPPEEVVIPVVDFDSEDPNSYKNKAAAAESFGLCRALCNGVECSTQCVFTQSEFDNLLADAGEGGTLTLESSTSDGLFSVYYVDGSFELRGKRNLIVNGALVVGGNALIGETRAWGGGSGNSQITISDPGLGVPSGILTKGNVKFGKYSSSAATSIVGLVYTLGNFELTNVPHLIEITGGQIAAGNFQLTSVSQGVNIYSDSVIITEGLLWGLGDPLNSPVISVEHWEESY